MACLQRGILTVVRKTEEFLGSGVEISRVTEHVPQGGQCEHCRCGAAALAAQGRQLGQITADRAVICNTTLQAKSECAGDEPPWQPRPESAIGGHRHGERAVPSIVGLQPWRRRTEVNPVLRVDAVLDVVGVEDAVRIRHDVAKEDVVVLMGAFGQLAWLKAHRLPCSHGGPDRIILLATVATEAQGEEGLLTLPWLELLAVDREIPHPRRLQGPVEVSGPGDELMQPEGQETPAGQWGARVIRQ